MKGPNHGENEDYVYMSTPGKRTSTKRLAEYEGGVMRLLAAGYEMIVVAGRPWNSRAPWNHPKKVNGHG